MKKILINLVGAGILAVGTIGCDTPGGNYAIGSSYDYLANQNAAQGNFKQANAYGAGAGFFRSMGNAEAARKAAEAGRSQVNQNIYIGSDGKAYQMVPVQNKKKDMLIYDHGDDGITRVYRGGKLIDSFNNR